MPATYAEFSEWWPEKLDDDEIFLTDEARTAGINIGLHMPAPTLLRPAMDIAGFLILGSLPGAVRDAYGLHWTRAQQITYDAAALSMRRARPLVPSSLRRGSSAEAYKLLERTERNNLRAGKRSFQPVA
jgi:uncharacterized protein (DUF2236 family)